ncbi:MAG: hypothetical protein ABFE07_28950 [Armatimonadia bacterium]
MSKKKPKPSPSPLEAVEAKAIMEIIHHRDICYTVRAIIEDVQVYFTVFEMAGEINGERPCWRDWRGEITEDLSSARLDFQGWVKWDGCSDWDFHPYPRAPQVHNCSRAGLEDFGQVLLRCWDYAKAHLPNFDQ